MLKKELEAKVRNQNVEIGKLTTSCKEQAKRIADMEQQLAALWADGTATVWKQQAEEFAKTIKKLQEVLAQNKHEVVFVQAAISSAVPDDYMEDAKPWERLEAYSKQQREELNALLALEYHVPSDFALGTDPVYRLHNYLAHLQYQARKPAGLEIPVTLNVKVKHDG